MPGGQKWIDDRAEADINFGGQGDRRNSYAFGTGSGVSSPSSVTPPSLIRKKSGNSPFPPPSWGRRKSGGSYFNSEPDDSIDGTDPFQSQNEGNQMRAAPQTDLNSNVGVTDTFPEKFKSDYNYLGTSTSSQRGMNTHRPTLSLGVEQSHNTSYRPGSPFNDLPPFPRMPNNNNSHMRSASSGTFFGTNRGTNNMSRSTSNTITPRESDPFAYDSPGETIDDLPSTLSALRLEAKVGLNEPLRPSDGIGRAIALYNFKAVEVCLSTSLCAIFSNKSSRPEICPSRRAM